MYMQEQSSCNSKIMSEFNQQLIPVYTAKGISKVEKYCTCLLCHVGQHSTIEHKGPVMHLTPPSMNNDSCQQLQLQLCHADIFSVVVLQQWKIDAFGVVQLKTT